MDAGTIGGVIGGTIGVLGGAFGTYHSIRSAKPGRERRFVEHCSIIAWIAVSTFLALLLITPISGRWILWLVYGISLPVTIIWMNKAQSRIRADEKTV